MQDARHPDGDRVVARDGAQARERHHPRDGDGGPGHHEGHARGGEAGCLSRLERTAARAGDAQRPGVRRALPRQRVDPTALRPRARAGVQALQTRARRTPAHMRSMEPTAESSRHDR